MNRIVSGQAAESGNYSFLRLLSTIGELIDLLCVAEQERAAGVARVLRSATQARSYPTPAAHEVKGSEASEFEDEHEIDAGGNLDPFAAYEGIRIEDVLNSWLDQQAQTSRQRPLAPVTLSRMWTRFTYTFYNMRDELVHGQTRYLGVLMHRTVIAFLHSVGYEAMRAANADITSSLANNPVRSGQVFARLLREIYDTKNHEFKQTPEFAFFDLIFSCPLWHIFLHGTNKMRSRWFALPSQTIASTMIMQEGRMISGLTKMHLSPGSSFVRLKVSRQHVSMVCSFH